MSHIESGEQAIERLEQAAERRERTIRKAHGDENRVSQAEYHHLRTVRNTRFQVRNNAGISNLEQGILGTAGSLEELKKYKELAQQLREQAGQPLVAIESVVPDGDEVQQAVVGEIDGSLQAWANFLNGNRMWTLADPQQETSLMIPANGLTRFSRNEEDWQLSPAKEHGSSVVAADIVLDEGANPIYDAEGNCIGNPEQDFTVHNRIENGSVLVGEEAIRGNQLFEPDLKTIAMMSGHTV